MQAFAEAKPAAIEQLEKLAEHAQWWVRLYVLEVLRQHSELQSPEVRERLRKDERVQKILMAGEEQQ